MGSKIPVTVLTGFLGAGKTTLVRHILNHAGGRRIALIINEFGDLGVDADTLEACGSGACAAGDIVELSNGCICCTVSEDFVPAMTEILGRDAPPDHIVIETSGLALPQPLIRAFRWPELRNRLTVDGVIVVVDGNAVALGRFADDPDRVEAERRADPALDHATPLGELFEDQLASADIVVVNKSDLLAPGTADDVVARVRGQSRRSVQVVKASNGALPIDVLLGIGAGAEQDLPPRAEIHHAHDDEETHDADDHAAFESIVVECGEVSDQAALCDRIAETVRAHDVLRVKGFAAVAGKPLRLSVQAVGQRIDAYFDRPFRTGEARSSRIVFIGMAGLDQSRIRAGLTSAAC